MSEKRLAVIIFSSLDLFCCYFVFFSSFVVHRMIIIYSLSFIDAVDWRIRFLIIVFVSTELGFFFFFDDENRSKWWIEYIKHADGTGGEERIFFSSIRFDCQRRTISLSNKSIRWQFLSIKSQREQKENFRWNNYLSSSSRVLSFPTTLINWKASYRSTYERTKCFFSPHSLPLILQSLERKKN